MTPLEVRQALLPEEVGQFDSEWRLAMSRSAESLDLTEVFETLARWQHIAELTRADAAAHRRMLARADRILAGEEEGTVPLAKQLGDMRKVVVSRQPLEFSWRNSELIEGDLVEAVTALKGDAGIKGILIPGSISVVQQLLAAGLVDELRLVVHPVAARKGRRLFDEGDAPYHLEVSATEAFPTGSSGR